MRATYQVNTRLLRILTTVILLSLLCLIPYAAEAQPGTTSYQQADLEPGSGVKELRNFSSPQLRARYYTLLNELRCPKCQNQNLADSDAPIAADLRNELFSLLEEGYTDQQILEFMTARYGTFVLYQPPFAGYTLALWLLPPILLGLCALMVWRIVRASHSSSSNLPDTQDKKKVAESTGEHD